MAHAAGENVLSTFHGRVYGNKKVRKESDLPEDLTNASAATRRVFDPAAPAPKHAAKDKSKHVRKVVHKRISSSGDELQNQIDSGWVNVNLSLMAVTDLIHFVKKLTAGVATLRTLKLDCFPKDYDRLEADAVEHNSKPKYQLASADHEALVKSTMELVCNPKLKGKVAAAIKEVFAQGKALEELIIGLSLPPALWKSLSSSLESHEHLRNLSLAGSATGDATLQVLSDGLRANQTIAELNLSGCKLTDDGVRTLAGLIKASAAEADVQEWHEGLREYPDLSLAPPLRRQQFRAKNREIRGRVLARCGGLQVLQLAENKITDAGAALIVDALAMDRCMVLLDLAANQLTKKSARGFSKLMAKHKGLLQVDLRSNADGLSGVLQMMPKSRKHLPVAHTSNSSVQLQEEKTAALQMLPHADAAVPSQQGSDGGFASGYAFGYAADGTQMHALHKDGIKAAPVDIPNAASGHVHSRKGLVPTFSADDQHVNQAADKENAGLEDAEYAQAAKHSIKVAKASARQGSSNLAHRPLGSKAQHVRPSSTAGTAQSEFGFEAPSVLQSQPTASLNHFAAAGNTRVSQGARHSKAAERCDSSWEAAGSQLPGSFLDNAAVGSASFDSWAHEADECLHQPHNSARPSKGRSSRLQKNECSTVSMPAHLAYPEIMQDHMARSSQREASAASACEAAVDAVADSAYLRGMTEAWREVQEAEELGKQRAATDFDAYQAAAAEAAVMSQPDASGSADDSAQAAAVQQQSRLLRPTSARHSTGQAIKHSGQGSRAGTWALSGAVPVPHHATRVAQPQHAQQGDSKKADLSHKAAIQFEDGSQQPDQAIPMVAAAAVEAAKMNVWKAEVMNEIEGLKLSLQGATAERQRAEARMAELWQENQSLKLVKPSFAPAIPLSCPSSQIPEPAEVQQAVKNSKRSSRKRLTMREPKKKVKGSKAADRRPDADAEEEVFQGQQQVLGDLSQVIRNLDELVSDIEDTRAHPHGAEAIRHHAMQDNFSCKQYPAPQQSVRDVLADVAQQLSAKCDLHDSLSRL